VRKKNYDNFALIFCKSIYLSCAGGASWPLLLTQSSAMCDLKSLVLDLSGMTAEAIEECGRKMYANSTSRTDTSAFIGRTTANCWCSTPDSSTTLFSRQAIAYAIRNGRMFSGEEVWNEFAGSENWRRGVFRDPRVSKSRVLLDG
jgi:hypothetical protein